MTTRDWNTVRFLTLIITIGCWWDLGVWVLYGSLAGTLLPAMVITAYPFITTSTGLIGSILKDIRLTKCIIIFLVLDLMALGFIVYGYYTNDYSIILYSHIVLPGLSAIFGVPFTSRLDGIYSKLYTDDMSLIKRNQRAITSGVALGISLLFLLIGQIQMSKELLYSIVLVTTIGLGLVNTLTSLLAYRLVEEFERRYKEVGGK